MLGKFGSFVMTLVQFLKFTVLVRRKPNVGLRKVFNNNIWLAIFTLHLMLSL